MTSCGNRLGSAFAGALLLTGCGTLPPRDLGSFPPDQVMVVNGKGRLLKPVGNCGPTTYTSLKEMRETIPIEDESAYAARMAQHVLDELQAGRRVVLFFHGGLNLQISTMERARCLLDLEEQTPAGPSFVFLNWQSSLLSSYRDHLFAVREGKDYRERALYKNIGTKLTSPLYFISDTLAGVGRVPVTLERQAATTMSGLSFRPPEDITLARAELSFVRELINISEPPETAVDLYHAVPSVLMAPTRVITTPLVDGFGGPAWNVMQRRTTILFDRETVSHSGDGPQIPGRKSQGPLSKFGQELSDRVGNTPYPGHLVLVGHSMGTILASELLRRFPALRVDDIVFMAAACSIRDIADSIIPYLADPAHQQTRFYNLVLHPEAETRESHAVHMAPEGSLLVWLDQLLDKPDAMPDRTAGRYVNLGLNARYLDQAVRRVEGSLWARIFIKVFPYAAPGEKGQPMQHGDFGAFSFWEESFWDPSTTGPYTRYPGRHATVRSGR